MTDFQRLVLTGVLCLALGAGCGWFGRDAVDPNLAPAVVPPPAAAVAPGGMPGVLRVTRLELVDAAGRPAGVLAAENGALVATVNDNGVYRRLSLSEIAHRFGR